MTDYVTPGEPCAVKHDEGGAKFNPRYPWRTRCTTCGWSDTFAGEWEAHDWAMRHNDRHADDPAPVSVPSQEET